MTARVVRDDGVGRAEAIDVLNTGGIVALPTDTVYGIGVALSTPGGIERLFAVKQRPPERGVALLVGSPEQAAEVGRMTPSAKALAEALWPGGLTIVIPQRSTVPLPTVLTGGAPTIGLRLPDHPTPRALAAAIGPLPVTSANVSGRPEAVDAMEIVAQLGHDIDLVLDGGRARGGPPSTVVDCSGERAVVLRLGAIGLERIAAVLSAAGLELRAAPV